MGCMLGAKKKTTQHKKNLVQVGQFWLFLANPEVGGCKTTGNPMWVKGTHTICSVLNRISPSLACEGQGDKVDKGEKVIQGLENLHIIFIFFADMKFFEKSHFLHFLCIFFSSGKVSIPWDNLHFFCTFCVFFISYFEGLYYMSPARALNDPGLTLFVGPPPPKKPQGV